MSKGLHQNELDFEILETGNSKTLVFVDSSDYLDDSPERPLLEVLMPGFTKYLLVNVAARRVNTFNSSTLGINEVLDKDGLIDLLDGVWILKYKICPYTYVYITKKIFRQTLLINKLKKLYNDIDVNGRQDDLRLQNDLIKIHIAINGCKAVVERDSKRAQEYYRTADKLIQRSLDNCFKNSR